MPCKHHAYDGGAGGAAFQLIPSVLHGSVRAKSGEAKRKAAPARIQKAIPQNDAILPFKQT